MASLIEEFIYAFVAETQDYEAGAKRVETAGKKTEQSINANDKTANKLIGSFKNLAVVALGTAAAFLSFAGIKAATVAAAEQTAALGAQARALRMSADDLDVWQRANEAAGGSAEGMAATFKMLSERTRDPIKALEQIADRFKGVSDIRADRLGRALGLDPGTVEMLRKGKDGLVELIREQQRLGHVTEEQIAASREWRLQSQLTGYVLDDTKRQFMMALIPSATEWLKAMRNVITWMRENKEFTLAFFAGIAAVLTARLLPALIRVGIAAAPWIALAAAVAAVGAAIGLVVDDIMAFEAGGRSLIGQIAEQWPIVGDIVHAIVDAFYILRDVGTVVFQLLRDAIFAPKEALDNFYARLNAIADAVEKRFPKIAALMRALGGTLTEFFTELAGAFNKVLGYLNKVIDAAGWLFEKLGGGKLIDMLPGAVGAGEERYKSPTSAAAAGAAVAAGRGSVAATAGHPLASTTSNAISNTSSKTVSKNTQVNTGPITVQTQATNGQDVAAALGAGLGAQVRGAIDEFDDGVAI